MTHVAANTSTPVHAKSSAPSEPLLEVRDLSVSFNDGSDWFEVLNKVSFDVRPGETVVDLGSGGGLDRSPGPNVTIANTTITGNNASTTGNDVSDTSRE